MIVAQGTLAQGPDMTIERTGGDDDPLSGPWTAPHAQRVEALVEEIAAEADHFPVLFDLSGVERLDTLGAWTLGRTKHELSAKGQADFANASPSSPPSSRRPLIATSRTSRNPGCSATVDFFVDVGKSVAGAGKDWSAESASSANSSPGLCG